VVFFGWKPLLSLSGDELPLPVSYIGESIDADAEGIKGRVEDDVVLQAGCREEGMMNVRMAR
jgi:hypothetical protein